MSLKQKIRQIFEDKVIDIEKLRNPEEQVITTKKKICEDLNVELKEITDSIVAVLDEAKKQIQEAIYGRVEIEITNLADILAQVNDPKLLKLPYKKRFESIINAIANQKYFLEKIVAVSKERQKSAVLEGEKKEAQP